MARGRTLLTLDDMYKASGTIRGWLPAGTPFDLAKLEARLVTALKAEGATRVSSADAVVRFDGGGGKGNFDPLMWIATGELRLQGMAPNLAAFRAGDVQYRVDYAVRTPVVLVFSVMVGIILGGLVGFSIGELQRGLVDAASVTTLYTLVAGGLWLTMVRLSFCDFVHDALRMASVAARASGVAHAPEPSGRIATR